MYPRYLYIAAVSLAVASLQFSAAMGTQTARYAAYAVTVGFGLVIFLQGEKRVTSGPIFVNAGIALLAGTAVSLLLAAGLAMALLGTPWDYALWLMGIRLWGDWVLVSFVFVSTFFLAAVTSAMR